MNFHEIAKSVWLPILAAGFFATVAFGQSAENMTSADDGMVVKRVEFQGLSTVGEGFLRRNIKTREGQNYLRNQLEADVRELRQSRKFLNVFADTYVEGGQAVVVIVVDEKPVISGVLVKGNREIKDQDLYRQLPKEGDPVDRYAVDRGTDEILRQYRKKGYYYAEVTIDEASLKDNGRLVYAITEGPRVKLKDIEYEGVETLPKQKVKKVVQLTEYFPVFQRGAFEEDMAKKDVVAIERLYRGEGFLDVRVSYRLDFDDAARTDLTVTFVIEEGVRYRVQDVIVEGNETFTDEQILGDLLLQPGSIYRDEPLQKDTNKVQEMYGEIGFVNARVLTSYDYLDEPGLVRLRYTIGEGVQSKFGRVILRGNYDTKDSVVRARLPFTPGYYYNVPQTRKTEKRLMETGFFNKATISPLDDVDGYRDTLITLDEADAVMFLIGVGVSTDSGVLGSISLNHKNFDLFDWPRSWGEFFRGQAFRGGGQQFRLEAEPGTKMTRFRMDFVEPYLFDKPLRLGTSFYLWERGREVYDEQRFGLTVSLGRRFETGPLNGWAMEGAFRVEGVSLVDVDPLAAREIRLGKGDHVLTSLKAALVRDTTDSRFRPTEGYRLGFSWEQFGALGGDHSFAKPSAEFAWYKTLRTDMLDRKSVLATRADIGYIAGDAPVFERHYAGGFGNVRGFQFRGISPRNGIRDDAVGGDFLVLTAAEYSFPLYGEAIRGVTFLDMGTVEESLTVSSWRASVGFGLRMYVEFFGPVPIVLDWAFPIAKEEEDETQVFNFSFGASF